MSKRRDREREMLVRIEALELNVHECVKALSGRLQKLEHPPMRPVTEDEMHDWQWAQLHRKAGQMIHDCCDITKKGKT